MVISLERDANDLLTFQLMPLPPHPIVSCFIKIQIGLTFMLPAYPGYPEKEAIKRVCLSESATRLLLTLNTRSREWSNFDGCRC